MLSINLSRPPQESIPGVELKFLTPPQMSEALLPMSKPQPAPGQPVRLPPRYAVSGKIHGNPVRQVARSESHGLPGARRFGPKGQFLGRTIARSDGPDALAVYQARAACSEFVDVLLVPGGDHESATWPTVDDLQFSRWVRPAILDPEDDDIISCGRRCRAVTETWKGQFAFREEVRDGDTVLETGLRPPQTGALYAALGHWRATSEPATIVMPTGTGKTETMLALFVHERLPRLLVVVPTKALRAQTVRKFETLGLLNGLGVVGLQAAYPVVGTLAHKPQTSDEVDDIFLRCNVIVTTMNIVGQCSETVQQRMAEQCSHLFIDEAHRISAPTWNSFRRAFLERSILQFTATPFRTDGKHVEGKVIFNYPLRKAQEEGYFKPIRFRPINEFDAKIADYEIARVTLEQLDSDLASGLNHIVMVRAADIERAKAVHAIYVETAPPEHRPILLHSELGEEESRAVMDSLLSGETRIVVCVDMLGEGFDLPQLKIAALHDMHKSLAITLQFTGRFIRTHPDIGDATMIANIADPDVEEKLKALYAENADWNSLLRTLSEGATGRHVKKSEFLARFMDLPAEIALQSVEPKMSAVVYHTRCADWRPDRALAALGEDRVFAGPTVNPVDRALLAVTRDYEPVRWGTVKELSNVVWHLYLVHWDAERQLLFINSSDNDSLHEKLAEAIGGPDVELIQGETVFRALDGITRLVLMNLGLNHTISRSIRFSMHVGSDIGPAIAEATAQNKIKSNLFGIGYENGERATMGCSQKGRLWSHLIAYDMAEWVEWCHKIGTKLIDATISTRKPFRNLVVPKLATERPCLVPLAIEWGKGFFERHEDEITVGIAGEQTPFYETRLELLGHTQDAPIRFRVTTGTQSADYELQFGPRGLDYVPIGPEIVTVSIGRKHDNLTERFRRDSPVVFFEDGSTLQSDHLYTPPGISTRIPFPTERIVAWSWAGTDLSVESQTHQRLGHSIQRRVILDLVSPATNPPWDVVFDDDDALEAADIVAIRFEGDRLIVHLYHCKYSGGPKPGARVGDLYEVCGQAQRSIRWKSDVLELFRHLRLREDNRMRKLNITRFERGNLSKLAELSKKARLVRADFKVFIVQPGISKAEVSKGQLDLLAATELYLKETLAIDMAVIGSA